MDVILQPKTNLIIDSQLLSSWMSCWRLANWTFNEDLQPKGGKTPNLEMGSIVHAYLENRYQKTIDRMPKAQAIAFGMAAAIKYSKSDEVRNATSEDIALALDTCIQYENRYHVDIWTPLEVETVKKVQIYEDDKIRIMWAAKYDLIVDTGSQGLILPVDHKTMKQRRDTLTLNNQFMGQCRIMEKDRMIVNKVGFQKTLKPEERFQRVVLNYTADRIKEWCNEIVPYYAYEYIKHIEQNLWPPNFTHCENKYGHCRFKDVCEANRNMREDVLRNDFVKGRKWDIVDVTE